MGCPEKAGAWLTRPAAGPSAIRQDPAGSRHCGGAAPWHGGIPRKSVLTEIPVANLPVGGGRIAKSLT